MRADRLIALVLILQNRGKRSCRILAEELEVSRRTILRDVDALSSAGIPVMAEGGRGGGIWLDESYRSSLTGFNEAELRALLIGGDAALAGDLGLGKALSLGRLKLRASLPRRFGPALESVRKRILVDSRWWWNEEGASAFLKPLQEAVIEDAVIDAEYERYDGSIGRGRIEAYGLVAKAGLWYFVGHREGEYRSYRVSRFRSVRDTGERFARDPSFELDEWWPRNAERFTREFSAYRFVLALPEERLRFVQWIAPGRVEARGRHASREGWIEAEIGVDSGLYAELLVLGLGAECRVLDPPALAEAVVARARSAIEAHARPDSAGFWESLDGLVAEKGFVIDRKKGSAHPRYPDMVYPLDYGYIPGTASMDGAGIDLFEGASGERRVTGILCTIDRLKDDSEIKALYGCDAAEMATARDFINASDMMKALLVRRD